MNSIKKILVARILKKIKELDDKPRSPIKGGDITRKMLAEKAGVSMTTFFNVLKCKASLDSIVKVAESLEVVLLLTSKK